MAERLSEGQEEGGDEPAATRRRHRWRRWLSFAAIGLLLVIVAILVTVWMARRPIAERVLDREFERRGVQATYDLDRVGLRTQQVSNLVIGDPKHPDLTARVAQVQLRVKWDGSVEVYRIVARGVRLRGELKNGKVSWGQIDKLLPPPSGKPFQLPDFTVDVADTTISLKTPFGPVGFALEGRGNLTGGFKGKLAVRSPALVPGRCRVTSVRANLAVEVIARKPHVEGPIAADRLSCPASRFVMDDPSFMIDSRFNESFTDFNGSGRMTSNRLIAGPNGIAQFAGNLTFKGDLDSVRGEVNLSARQSKMGTISAERTRLNGRYRLGYRAGSFVMAGDYAAESATLAPQMVAGITQPLAGAAKTPIGPIATAIGNAVSRTVRQFNAAGAFRMVNFPGGGAVRIDSANVRTASGARARVSGDSGITYYWPANRIRIDTSIAMQGGGLPTGRITIRQPRDGDPMSGVARFAPYSAGGARLELAPIRFSAGRGEATRFSTVALLTGPIPNGRVRGLRLPIEGRLGPNGSLAVGNGCTVVSFDYLSSGSIQLGPTRLPVCPTGPAILTKPANGDVRIGASFRGPVVQGRIGDTPLRVAAAQGEFQNKGFVLNDLKARLGQAATPIIFNARRLQGTFRGSGISGTFSGGNSKIGNVPIAMSDIDADWRLYDGVLTADGSLLASDRADEPRFYPLRSNDFRFRLGGDSVTARGTLMHPGTGTRVTNVDIHHSLSKSSGHADLVVPGLTFNEGLQPDQLTRLTEGVVALVRGTVTGRGRINWSGSGHVTSTGEFTTANMDLAAPFGPVTGLSTTVRFSDLLGLETEPGQVATIASINPGILVENGVIRYQLLPDQLVKIERGEWPFMGGRLVLRETILNFGRPSAKRLTFEVIGLNAKIFVESLGFEQIQATGVFDGVLPMIFDENGGRIVGGRLDSRPPGGTLAYVGEAPDLGFAQRIAFEALRALRYRSMVIRLDGDLAGEFAARLSIDGVALGQTNSTQRIVRGLLAKVPIKLNVNIRGPFRALIATAKSLSDPRAIIADVLPRPLEDVPGIVTEVRRREDETTTETHTEQDQNANPSRATSER